MKLTREIVVLVALVLSACSRNAAPSEEANAAESVGQEDEPVLHAGPECGRNVCKVGDVCCNASCGICTPPDGMCTQQVCMEQEPLADEPEGISCANVRCPSGTRCEMVEVQCVRAPCNPVPQCIPDEASSASPAGSAPDAAPAIGKSCGRNTCATGQVCCNQSCGICSDPGKGCIKLHCSDGKLPSQ